ncbi:MAG: CYTH domain-containing protein [Tannerellaceae bacterium]|jgi:CYTH domain-containing protein|nr:CYTH domain-containing protein [Tannerellaceae bacterium]
MIEIERKFTLLSGNFRKEATHSRRITQGYICADEGRTVRIRLSDGEAFLTIKGPSDQKGWSRYEFEQKIPTADAVELLQLCREGIIDKIRYYIPQGKHVWEVDVFCGENEGLEIAEIELAGENEPFDKPAWLGKEVTGDERYYNAMLAHTPYKQWKNKD